MYIKNCPICNSEIIYKNKYTLNNSIKKNRKCKKCQNNEVSMKLKGKSISEDHKKNISLGQIGKKLSEEHKNKIAIALKGVRAGIPLTEEHKKKLSLIKKGIKLSEEHKKNIGISVKGKIRSEESKKRYSESKMGDKNPNFIPLDKLQEIEIFKMSIERLTNHNKKILLNTWNGLDYYDNEFIKNNFDLNYNDNKYPTIDHKISIIHGLKNGFTPEQIGCVENLCFTKRIINNQKNSLTEEKYKEKLKK